MCSSTPLWDLNRVRHHPREDATVDGPNLIEVDWVSDTARTESGYDEGDQETDGLNIHVCGGWRDYKSMCPPQVLPFEKESRFFRERSDACLERWIKVRVG